jgi:hypothetical protein
MFQPWVAGVRRLINLGVSSQNRVQERESTRKQRTDPPDLCNSTSGASLFALGHHHHHHPVMIAVKIAPITPIASPNNNNFELFPKLPIELR